MDLELPKQLGATFLLAQSLQTNHWGKSGPPFLKPLVAVEHVASALGQTLSIHFCKSDPDASTREYSE